jgi:hypothetical protein
MAKDDNRVNKGNGKFLKNAIDAFQMNDALFDV